MFLAAVLLLAGAAPLSQATADTMPVGTTPTTVSADALPTVQVDGVVWKTEVVGTTAYAVGKFTTARPAGVPAGGLGEVPRSNILAFDVRTGELLPFAPVLNAQALVAKASPDGTRLYVGGDFTTVDGVVRSKIASFNLTTGALETSFRPGMSSRVRALAVTSSTVYIGGDFRSVNGVARTRLAAVSRPYGALLGWVPTADDDVVEALVAAPDGSRIVVGGRFQTLNTQPFVGVGAVDGTTGAILPWAAKITPAKKEINGVMKRSWVTDLVVQDGVVYGSNNGDGHHWFDGRWAADFDTGSLVWLDNCYGATYGLFVRSQVLYSVGHPHDCSSLGAFPETSPITYRRAVAETTYAVGRDTTPPSVNSTISNQPVPQLLDWYPDLNAGSFTGQGQGPWSIDGNAQYVVLGGEFTRVNGVPQQGLTRFAVSSPIPEQSLAPNEVGPVYTPTLLPSALSLRPGTVRVAWPTTWDRDNARLTYEVHRGTTLVFSAERTPTGWTPSGLSRPTSPSMGFLDTGLTPGASHRYTLSVKDPFGNVLDYMHTARVTVAGSAPSGYPAAVLADGASSYWRLGETGGTSLDHAGYDDLAESAGVTTAPGALAGDADAAGLFNGTETGIAVTEAPVQTSGTFSLEAWVRTTSTTGGKVLGYASNTTGPSSVFDRSLYVDNTGALVFGMRTTTGLKSVASAAGFNDGAYHHVVGTFSPTTGMALYVDGRRVAVLTGLTAAVPALGYWRVGGDNLDGWPRKPTSRYLAGSIDEVAVYPTALSATAVSAHSSLRGGTSNAAPTAALQTSCVDLVCTFDASGSRDADGSVQSYTFDPGDVSGPVTGAAAQRTHTYAGAGTFPVTLTVTDDAGATASATAQVSPTEPVPSTVLASDSFERTVSGGWGSAPTGGTWSVAGGTTNFSVGGGTGNVLVAAGKSPSATLTTPSSSASDVSLVLRTDKPITGGGLYVSVLGRRVGADSYRAKVRLQATGAVGVSLVRVVGGVETAVGREVTVPGLTLAAGAPLAVRLQVLGTGTTTLNARVWPAGGTQPTAWQVTATDTSPSLQAAGGLGVLAYLSSTATNAPITVRFDDLTAVPR